MNNIRTRSGVFVAGAQQVFRRAVRGQQSTMLFVSAFAVFAVGNTPANGAPLALTQDEVKQQIFKRFPQADTDKDGVISDAEEAAVRRQIIRRFPRADRDGDGVLSDKETRAVLRQAANRAGKNNPNRGNSRTSEAKKKPTHANVKYGKHARQVFDIWLADSSSPTPLAIYIHGGGFKGGSKEKLKAAELSQLLKSGISVAAINYRFMTTAPLPTPHHDARRALQYMRSKASEWNIDKNRVAAFGGSAGAQICMWLAFTNVMAKPTAPIRSNENQRG